MVTCINPALSEEEFTVNNSDSQAKIEEANQVEHSTEPWFNEFVKGIPDAMVRFHNEIIEFRKI